MNQISEEVVEKVWDEFTGFSDAAAFRELKRVGAQQRDLLGFVFVFTEELRPEVHELAVFLYFVIYRIFQKATPGKIRPIKGPKIQRCWERNEELLSGLAEAHPRFLEKVVLAEASGQPFVVKGLVEAIMSAPLGDDPIILTEEESGTLFLILKTVIDVLDQARQQELTNDA